MLASRRRQAFAAAIARSVAFLSGARPPVGGCLAVAVLAFAASAIAQEPRSADLQRIDRARLCVTNGVVTGLADGRLAVDTPSSRAIVQASGGNAADQVAEIRFEYLGPSRDSRPLASGELRRQIGLKLRAEDTCNVIYAMWHIEPDARVAVSVKRNADLHTNAQCGARGYLNFKPQDREPPPPIAAGETHTLRAELHGEELTVTADGKIAWQGSLAGATALPVGPPGFRTDNARFVFDYFASPAPGTLTPAPDKAPGQGRCSVAAGD
jgi:hypothetical protein